MVSRWGSHWFSAPPPVPFFPEVHEELTRSWKAPFTARNKSCISSALTTLDGGAALDLALRATKVTAQSLGCAMSTLVVQERHLWLCLADMKEHEKVGDALRQRCRELCPAVLGSTEAD